MNPASCQSISSSRDSNNTRFKNGERITAALDILRDGRISLLELITTILDPTQTALETYWDRFYTRPQNMETLMESIMLDKQGKYHINSWIGERAVDWLALGIYNEMDLIDGEFNTTVLLISHPRCCLAGVSFRSLSHRNHAHRQGRPQLKLYRDSFRHWECGWLRMLCARTASTTSFSFNVPWDSVSDPALNITFEIGDVGLAKHV